jgi:RNA polymerase sigma-70 factor (ECF subfamily)
VSGGNEKQFLYQALNDSLDSLFSTALRLVGKREIAEDLVQETVRKALEGVPQLRDQRKARAWLFKILVNCARDHLRLRRDWDELEDDQHTYDLGCDVQTIARATAHDVREALGELEASRRAVVVLIDIEDFTIAEAADMLSIPMGTAASRLARARQELRTRLRAYQPQITEGGGKP